MAEPLINPDDFGKVLDTDVESLDQETEGVGLVTPDNMATLFDNAITTGGARTNELATQNAMIQGRGTDLATINLAKADFNSTASLALAAENLFLTLEGRLSDAGSAFGEIAPNELPGVLDQLVEGQRTINDMRSSPVANELAVIQRATTVPLAKAVSEELAFNLGVRNEISRMLDDQGKLDFISDIGGNFIPFRMGLDFDDVKANITEHAELKDAIDGESIQGMIATWQALPTDRKQALIKPLTEAVLAATGVDYSLGLGVEFLKSDKNVLNAAGILLRFLQPEGGERALLTTQVLTGLDIASFGTLGLSRGAVRSARTGTQLAALNKIPLNTRKIMEGLMGNAAEYSRKKHNPVKLIAQSGDTKEAAAVNLSAVTDVDMAKVYGMPSDVAYTNTMPMTASSAQPGFIQGLTTPTAEIMNDFIRGSKGFVRSMTTESSLLRLGALNKSDRALVVRNFYNEMELKTEDLLQEGIHLTDVKVIPGSQNAMGFSYEYTMANTKQEFLPAGGGAAEIVPTTHTAFRSWRVDEVTGNFVETVKDLAAPTSSSVPGQSPAAWSVTKPGEALDFNDAVKQSIALEDIGVATKSRINDQWLEANKSINGLKDTAGRGRIEVIELAGDEYVNKGTQIRGKVYTERELAAGIQTSTGTVHLTKPNEVEAYYKRRVFADSLWDMQNFVTRRELQLGGFNNSITAKGQQLAVKQFATPEAAKMSAANRPNFNVHLANENITTQLTEELIDKMYAKGRILVRSRNDWNVTGAGDLATGGEVVEYLFIEANRLRNLPEQVLHYKPGYVPKINEGVEFVVKQRFPVTKTGVQGHTIDHVLRAFSSEADAKLFKQRQVDLMVAKNPEILPEDAARLFEIGDGSKMKQMERMESALSGSGGLYIGTRSADDLLMGLDGVPIERMAPGEAFGRYIDHMGNALARNEWRIGQEKQWLNTVAKLDGKIKLEGFNGTAMPPTPEGKALGRLREQINTWNRVPTRQESLFEGMAQKYHDWALNGSRAMGIEKNAIKHALWLKHTDPIAATLTANMHLMLGAMNPAQVYVQASAAVVGLSLAKISDIPGILATTARFTMLDNVRDLGALQGVTKRLIATQQSTAAEIEIYEAWRRSGLYESVRSNADMNYISSTGVGVTADVLRKGSNASLIFYRAGELMNRRLSFTSAFTRWRAANPTAKMDDDALTAVVQESNKTMLELNAANKAWWQGGAGKPAPQRVFSMTGQFQQVLAKTVELSLKGEQRGGFTTAQKKRIAVGQLLMFGAAGIPLVSVVAPAMFEWLGVEPDDSMANAVNQGVTGTIVKEVFAADIDIANRAALFSSTFETVKDIITSKDPMWSKFLAVTGTTGQRVGEALESSSMVLQSQAFARLAELEPLLTHNRASETDMNVPTMLETAADMATIMTGITSSGRNLLKARMMHNSNKILDRRGRVTIEREDGFTFADKLGVALGFQLTAESRLRQVQQSNRDVDMVVNEAADVIIKAYHRYVYTHDMNPKYAQSVKNIQQMVHESLDNEFLIDKVNEQVSRKVFSEPQTLEDRELKKFYERTVPEKLSEGVILDTTLGLNPSNIFNKQAIVQPFTDTLEQENK
ncbi:MAG: hypothetical protein V3T88_02675 [Nitrosomonadaceae bacterium]